MRYNIKNSLKLNIILNKRYINRKITKTHIIYKYNI